MLYENYCSDWSSWICGKSSVAASFSTGLHCYTLRSKKSPGIDRVWDISQGSLPHPPVAWAVVHCAAAVDDWARCDNLEATNIKGIKHVLTTFGDVPLFIYVSSASVYDYLSTQKVFAEFDAVGKGF